MHPYILITDLCTYAIILFENQLSASAALTGLIQYCNFCASVKQGKKSNKLILQKQN